MILINKSEEPICLTDLKKVASKYDDLKNGCGKEVKELLRADQKGLCAYCQRKMGVVYIEHYASQAAAPEKQLDYANFFGVCSGKYYVDKKTGKKIDFCSALRGKKELTINPENIAHIETIYYDDVDFKILSSDETFDRELNDILKLNFDDLCLDRQISWVEEENRIIEMGLLMGLSKAETYGKAFRSLQNNKSLPEFVGYILFRLKKLIEIPPNGKAFAS